MSKYTSFNFNICKNKITYENLRVEKIKHQNPFSHKLKEYINVTKGYAFKSNDMSKEVNSEVKVLKVTNIDDTIDFNSLDNLPEIFWNEQKYSSFKIEEEDIIMCVTGSLGKMSFVKNLDSKVLLNQNAVIIRVKDKSELLPEYLYFALKSNVVKSFIEQKGLGMPFVNKADIENIFINIPPIEDQKRTLPLVKEKIKILEDKIKVLEKEREENLICNVVDKVFNKYFQLTSNSNKNKTVISSKPFSFIKEYLDFDYNNENISGSTDSLIPMSFIIDKGIDIKVKKNINNKKIVGLEDVEPFNGNIIDEDILSIGQINSEKVSFYGNDIMFAKMRPYLCKFIMINDVNRNYIGSSELFGLKINKKVITNTLIVKYLLCSSFVVNQYKKYQTGNGKPRISRENLLKVLIPKEIIEHQEGIILEIESLLNNKEYYDLNLSKIKNKIEIDLNKYILEGYSNDLFELQIDDV